jgi:vancomycin resistance protein YoaR
MPSGENKLSELQKIIEQTKQELEQIKQHEKPMPEFINTTNVIRSNEYLLKEIQTHAKLISVYEKYSQELEKMVLSTSVIKSKIKQLKSRINTRKKSNTKTKRRKKSSKKIRRKPRKTRKVKRKKLKRRR